MVFLYESGAQNLEKSRSGGGLGGLGSDFGSKNLSKAVLADFNEFGRARIDQNLNQIAQDGGKLEPRWHQDAPSWSQDG